MFDKIKYIKNVGQFYNVGKQIEYVGDGQKKEKQGSIVFKKFNLIYADNGTGKSTLTTILKSLRRNEPKRLIDKKTIGAKGESTVELQIGGEIYIFKNEEWNKILDQKVVPIEIFDEEFVTKNVFSLDKVESKNRRGLFKYTLGEEVFEKKKKSDKRKECLKKWNKKIEFYEDELIKAVGIDLIERLYGNIKDSKGKLKKEEVRKEIERLDNTDELKGNQLEDMKNKVEENDKYIKDEKRIRNSQPLEKISDFKDIDYENSISKDLSNLSIKTKYKEHVEEHNIWIKDGMDIKEKFCPFCRQDIKDNEAIETYKALFSDEYNYLRKKVENEISSIERVYGYGNSIAFNQIAIINNNETKCKFWGEVHKTIKHSKLFEFSSDWFKKNVRENVRELKSALKSVLERKQKDLLNKIEPNEDEAAGLDKKNKIKQAIDLYNKYVEEVNEKIKEIKEKSKNVEELKTKNDAARITIARDKVRYKNGENLTMYKYLKRSWVKKKAAENEIKKLRDEIDDDTKKILENYEGSINKELENFGVDFSIKGVHHRLDNKGEDRVGFKICLKGKEFDPNGSKDIPNNLGNTLSAGDRSALAFAFFIAKYREKEDISNQIFVFDDPMTSLDSSRKMQIKNAILKFVEKGAQVIVLTHSAEFARLFKDIKYVKVEKKDRCFIHLLKNESESGLSWTSYGEISDMIVTKHKHNYEIIKKYINDPTSVNPINVQRSVRPYVETMLMQYRPDFANLSLGEMIGKLNSKKEFSKKFIDNLKYVNNTIKTDSSHGSPDIDAHSHENNGDGGLKNVCETAIKIFDLLPKEQS